MKDSYIGQAWLVIVLGVCFGAALAGVQAQLSDRIDANKRNDTYLQVPRLVSGADQAKTQPVAMAGRTVYRAIASDGRQVGWVMPAWGQGFADRVELLIGLDSQAKTITGLYVLEQKETPGLGNRIEEASWRKQFAGKSTSVRLAATKAAAPGAHEIQAITGATISSMSVCGIVNEAVALLREELARQAKD